MSRPRLLDLFCGAGGAAVGYHRAGFDVVGVDNRPQPRYPFEFIQADAMQVLADSLRVGPHWVHHFDVVHASPPCQDYSRSMRHLAKTGRYPRLIGSVRDALRGTAVQWVIENVVGAPLPTQTDLFGAHGVELCGSMFGLRVWRHRLFETSFPVVAPRGCDHSRAPVNRNRGKRPGGRSSNREWRDGMGIDWMTTAEVDEAIPPAYTEYIGRQLLDHLRETAVTPV